MQSETSSEDLSNNKNNITLPSDNQSETSDKSRSIVKKKTKRVITKHTTTVTDIGSKQKELQEEINSKLKDFQTKIEDENKTKAEEADHLVNNVSNWNNKISDTKKDLEEITKMLAANNQRRLSKISTHSHSHSKPGSVASSSSVSIVGSRIPDSLYRPLTESGVDKKLLKQLDRYFHKREHDLKAQILNMHNQKKQNRLLKKCFLSWYNDMKNEKGEKEEKNDKEFMDNCNIQSIENDLIYEGLNNDDLEKNKNKENIKKLSVSLLNRNLDNMCKRITKQAFNKWIKLVNDENKQKNKKVLEKTEITMTYESKPMKFQNYCTEYNALLCNEDNDNKEVKLHYNECDICELIDDNNHEDEELEYVEYKEIICEDKNEYENENNINSNVIDTVDNLSFNVINPETEIKNPKFHNGICNKIPSDMKVEEVDVSFVTTASLSLITFVIVIIILLKSSIPNQYGVSRYYRNW